MDQEPIIDAHVNVASTRVLPEVFVRDTASNMHHRATLCGENASKAALTTMLVKQYQDHMADGLIKEMNGAGISQAILLAPDFTQTVQCDFSQEDVLKVHYAITQRHPGRFHVFAGVDPRRGWEAVELFERAVGQYGCSGLKLYPPAGFSPSDEICFPLYEICAAKALPVSCHTGPGWHSLDFTLGHPSHLDKATRLFPKVNFILGHGGVSYVEDAGHLCGFRENVYMDISGFPGVASADGWKVHLNRLFRLGFSHKIVFGTSWPASRMTVSLKEMVHSFRNDETVFNGVPKLNRRMIMHDNIARLLNLN